MKIRLIAAAAALLTSFCMFTGARADVYGSVRGTVTDDTGHSIASAQVVPKPENGATIETALAHSGPITAAGIAL